MTTLSCNCIVCAHEFNEEDLHSIALSSMHVTRFKICNSCINMSDPSNDYYEVRKIVTSYLKANNAKKLLL